MKKIAKVITECTDCEHCTPSYDKNSDKPNFLICLFPDIDPFIIATGEVRHYKHEIPENCPLEDYKTEEQ